MGMILELQAFFVYISKDFVTCFLTRNRPNYTSFSAKNYGSDLNLQRKKGETTIPPLNDEMTDLWLEDFSIY